MKRVIFLVALSLIVSFASGQPPAPSAGAQHKFFDSTSYVLPILIKVALTVAPEMKRQAAMKKVAENDLKQSKNEILKSFYVNGNYNYGSTPNSISGVQTSQFNAFNQNARALYLVGVNLNLSFEQIFGGIRTRIDKQKLIVEEAVQGAKADENTIRVRIITLYNALRLSKVLYGHAVDALQTAAISKSLVDKQLKAGELKITDQMASGDLYTRAETDLETTKSNYQLNLLLLEEAIGMPVNQFIVDYVK